MRTISLGVLPVLLLVTASVCADVPKDTEVKKDLEKLQGKWTVASIDENGKSAPAEEVAKYEITIKNDLFTIKVKDEATKQLRFKLDPSQKPAVIDLTPNDKKEKNVLGIYKIDGDTLTICATDENKERPTEFSATKGVALLVLKRAK